MHTPKTRSHGHSRISRNRRSAIPARFFSKLIFALLSVTAFARGARASGADQQVPQISAARTFTVTIVVDGVRNSTGQIGLLMFNSKKGWPDELKDAIRGTKVQAVAGQTVIKIDGLAAGDYGVLVIHDENLNQKLDHDWKGIPTEQWGMSNNPRVYLSAPSFDRARFHVSSDTEIHITLK